MSASASAPTITSSSARLVLAILVVGFRSATFGLDGPVGVLEWGGGREDQGGGGANDVFFCYVESINRKLFNCGVLDKFSELHGCCSLANKTNHDITKVRYYHNNEYYDPHTDSSTHFLAFSYFYKEPKKYAFSFQIMTLISRITQLRTALKNYTNTKWEQYIKDLSDTPQINLEGKFVGEIDKEINNDKKVNAT